MNEDHIPTQPVRELPNKRRRDDAIFSHTLVIVIALDVVLRVVAIFCGH